jgi:hypothetical protein
MRAPPSNYEQTECAAVAAIHELPLPTRCSVLADVFWGRFMNRPCHVTTQETAQPGVASSGGTRLSGQTNAD